ncbi:putative multidrug-efflux transporter/MT1670 [Roseovarius albus]|uniref:Putative multidrug-efflux transporter/MT1670 n=1 Tax=Roseovarius albus TaxID=1247867 RepID=A0A1X6YT51_9RHOB|nr:MFS transporter [Roseovarius albus]SLN29787.1 putative multidrug-efflux transporter/MT1670 [Roseovarius albus]
MAQTELPPAALSKDQRTKLALLCFAVWLHAASSMLAATTLPSAVREFGGGHLIGWAFALYLLGSIIAGSSTSLLTRRLGLRAAVSLAALLYGIGSMICAIAPNMIIVLAGRLVQGVGGGYLVAIAFVALRHWFAPNLVPKVMALISAVWSLSAFAGPLVGGSFATFANWRMAFVAAAVQAALFFAFALKVAPRSTDRATDERPSIPLLRLGLISGAVLSLAFAGAEVQPLRSTLLCILGIGMFLLMLLQDRKRPNTRLFPSRPFATSTPVGAGLTLVLSASFASVSFIVYGPILLETLHGLSPLAAGYIVAFESVCWGLAAVIVASFKSVDDAWLIRTGTVILSISLIGFALLMASGPVWAILACAGVQGAGFGIMWAFVYRRITDHADPTEADTAASAIPTIQQIGFACGAAASGLVANALGFGEDVGLATAHSAAFWVFFAFVPFTVIAAIAGWRLAKAQCLIPRSDTESRGSH